MVPRAPRFVCLGSISYDFIFQVERLPREHEKLRCPSVTQGSGGSAANAAFWLARLGCDVQIAASIGADAWGQLCTQQLSAVGVKTDLLQIHPDLSTGVATVFTNPTDKRMVTASGANQHLDMQRFDFSTLVPNTHIHLSLANEEKALALLQKAKQQGASTSCEFNGISSVERIKLCDYCFMNHDELRRWLGYKNPFNAWRKLAAGSNAALIVTCGSDGATLIRGNEEFHVAATQTNVVDRTGGGDAFDAGFLAGVMGGLDITASLSVGLELAAQVISFMGATNHHPINSIEKLRQHKKPI